MKSRLKQKNISGLKSLDKALLISGKKVYKKSELNKKCELGTKQKI